MAQTGQYGMICNSKIVLTLVPRCAYAIGNNEQCQIRIVSSLYEGVNAVVHVHEEGHATFEHVYRQPPIYVNGTVLKKKCLLLPDDTLTVLGKKFVYRNSVLTADDLRDRMAASSASCKPFTMKTPRPSRMTVVGTMALEKVPKTAVKMPKLKLIPKTEPKPQRAALKVVGKISKSASKIPTKLYKSSPAKTPKNTPKSIAKKTPKSIPKKTPRSTPKPRSGRKSSLAFVQSPADAAPPSSPKTPSSSSSSKKRKSAGVALPLSAKRPKSRQGEWLVEEVASPLVAKNLSLFAVSPGGDQATTSSARSSLRTSLLQRSVTKKFVTSRRSRHDFEDWRNVSDISRAESASMEVQTSGVQDCESTLDDGAEGGGEMFASPLSTKSNADFVDLNTSDANSVSVMEISSTLDDASSSPQSFYGPDIDSPKSGRQSRLGNVDAMDLSDVSLPGSPRTPHSHKKPVVARLPSFTASPFARYSQTSRSSGRSTSKSKKLTLLTDISMSDISLVSNECLEVSPRKTGSPAKSVTVECLEDSRRASAKKSIVVEAGRESPVEPEDDLVVLESSARQSESSRRSTESFRSRRTKSALAESANVSGVELLDVSDDGWVTESSAFQTTSGSATKSVSAPTTAIGSSTKSSASARKLRNTAMLERAVFNSSARAPEPPGSAKKSQPPSMFDTPAICAGSLGVSASVESTESGDDSLIFGNGAVVDQSANLSSVEWEKETPDVSGRKSRTSAVESRRKPSQVLDDLKSSLDWSTDSVFGTPAAAEKSTDVGSNKKHRKTPLEMLNELTAIQNSTSMGSIMDGSLDSRKRKSAPKSVEKSRRSSLFTPTSEKSALAERASSAKSRKSAFESLTGPAVDSGKKSERNTSADNSAVESHDTSTRMAWERKSLLIRQDPRKSRPRSNISVANKSLNGSVATSDKKKKSELGLLNELAARQDSRRSGSARISQRQSLSALETAKEVGLDGEASRASRSRSLVGSKEGARRTRSVLIPTASTETISMPTSTTDDFNDSYLDITESERSAVGNIITALNESNRYSDISDAELSVTSTFNTQQHKLVVTRRQTLPAMASPPPVPRAKRFSLLVQKRSSPSTTCLDNDNAADVQKSGGGQKRKAEDLTPPSHKKLRSNTFGAGMPSTKPPRQAYQFVTTEIPDTFKFNASGSGDVLSAESLPDNKILNLSSRSNIPGSARKSRQSILPDVNVRSSLLADDGRSNEENIPDVSSYSSLHTTRSSSFSFAKEASTDVCGIKRLFARTPRNNSMNLSGVKNLMATTKTPASPKNELRASVARGIKRIFRPMSPKNDLSDVRGVRTLLQTPKVMPTPSFRGMKRMFGPSSPKNDLSDIAGVGTLKHLFAASSPLNDLTDVRGVKSVFEAETALFRRDEANLSGIAGLFEQHSKDDVFDALLPALPPRTYRSKILPSQVADQSKVEYVDPDVEKWVEEQAQTVKEAAPDSGSSDEYQVTTTTSITRKHVRFDKATASTSGIQSKKANRTNEQTENEATTSSGTRKGAAEAKEKKAPTNKVTKTKKEVEDAETKPEVEDQAPLATKKPRRAAATANVQKTSEQTEELSKPKRSTRNRTAKEETVETVEPTTPTPVKKPTRSRAAKKKVETIEPTPTKTKTTRTRNAEQEKEEVEKPAKMLTRSRMARMEAEVEEPKSTPTKKATTSRRAKKEENDKLEEPKPMQQLQAATRSRRAKKEENDKLEESKPMQQLQAATTRRRAKKEENDKLEEPKPMQQLQAATTRRRAKKEENNKLEEPKPLQQLQAATKSRRAKKEKNEKLEEPKPMAVKNATSKKQVEEVAAAEEIEQPRATRSRRAAAAEAASVSGTTRSTRRKK